MIDEIKDYINEFYVMLIAILVFPFDHQIGLQFMLVAIYLEIWKTRKGMK